MFSVEITDDAKFDLINIEEYLFKRWGEKVADEFYQKLIDAIAILENTNVLFEKYEDTDFRKFLLTKHNTIIYKIENKTIFIVKILQNFQDPDENLKSIQDL